MTCHSATVRSASTTSSQPGRSRSFWRASALALAAGIVDSSSAQAVDMVISFSNQTWVGFNFSQITIGDSGNLGVGFQAMGTLTAVSVNATLNASASYTYANDLTIYVDPAPLATGGYLQVGGFSNLNATQRYSWANGASDAPGTTVIDTQTLTTPLVFAGTASDPVIWIGNGYGASGTSGTWTGTITLQGLTQVTVPEPGTVIMGMACAAVVGIVAYRRTRHADASFPDHGKGGIGRLSPGDEPS